MNGRGGSNCGNNEKEANNYSNNNKIKEKREVTRTTISGTASVWGGAEWDSALQTNSNEKNVFKRERERGEGGMRVASTEALVIAHGGG